MNKIDTIVLAGGLGTRMRPLTSHKPKPLILYQGVPLIVRIIDSLQEITDKTFVSVKYHGRQFEDLKYSYKELEIIKTKTENMVSAFFECCKLSKRDRIIGISSDIVFDPSLISQANQILGTNDNMVHVFLTKNQSQGYKKWKWIMKGNELTDIKVEKTSTSFEKLLICFPRNILKIYTNDYTTDMGKDEHEFKGYEEYNTGWIYLLKRLLDRDFKVKAHLIDGVIENVNSIEDLKFM